MRIYFRDVYGSLQAFRTINHNLLLTKLRTYGFSRRALNSLYSYLKNRTQKLVIINKTSSFEVVIDGAPQFSLEGRIISDLIFFLYTTDLSNFADRNNLYAIGTDKKETKRALIKGFQTVINWF